MARYLISFDDGAMTIPEEELPDVAEAAHKVVQEAKNAGVWVFGGGVLSQRASIVATDGTVTDGPYPETKAVIGGFSIVDVPSREEALAVGCQDRRRLPVCTRGTGDRARPERLIEGPPRLGLPPLLQICVNHHVARFAGHMACGGRGPALRHTSPCDLPRTCGEGDGYAEELIPLEAPRSSGSNRKQISVCRSSNSSFIAPHAENHRSDGYKKTGRPDVPRRSAACVMLVTFVMHA